MKRIITLFLVFAMLLTFTACEDKKSDTKDKNGDISANEDSDTSSKEKTKEESSEDSDKSAEAIDFAEMLVLDNETCSIKITDINFEKSGECVLSAVLENKTTDQKLAFMSQDVSINGLRYGKLYFYSEVDSGEKVNTEVKLPSMDPDKNKITEYTDIEASFVACDIFGTEIKGEGTAHIYPYGEDKVQKYVRESKSTDKVIMDNEYIKVIYLGHEGSESTEYNLNLFYINKSDKNLSLIIKDVSLNGHAVDTYEALNMSSGQCAMNSPYWDNLAEDNITKVENIKFSIDVSDRDEYDNYVKETITFNP